MTLKEKYESTGNWLFRWRSYLPLIMIILFLSAMPDYEYPDQNEHLDHVWEAFCLIISFFGLSIRIMTIGYTSKGTSGKNTKKQVAKTLNTTGLYSIVRNPLYLGNFFMGLGIALFPRSFYLILIYILGFWLYYERIIFAEEAYLRDKFGNKFLIWADSTPVIFPKFSQYRKPTFAFSWRKALGREYGGFFAVITVMFFFEIIGEVFAEGKFKFDLEWIVLLGIGFIVWVTVRAIKKHTNLLNVEKG